MRIAEGRVPKRTHLVAGAVAVAAIAAATYGLARTGVIVDTEETLWPNPRDRQAVHLSLLDRRLQGFYRDHGALPSGLEVVAGPRERADLWGTPLRYAPRDSTFVLRSAGPDRRFGTADDLVGEVGVTYASKRMLYQRALDSSGIR
jgi:hypothetical protein